MMNTIHPSFPDQQSINDSVNELSEEAMASYEELKRRYEEEINSCSPNHTLIADLIRKAQELLEK